MSEGTSGFRPPQLDGYSVERGPSQAPESRLQAAPEQTIRIVLRGANFVTRAMPLVIMIGDAPVTQYQIASDQNSVVCFLDEMPEEGSVISVGYGGEERVELSERFSRSRISGRGNA